MSDPSPPEVTLSGSDYRTLFEAAPDLLVLLDTSDEFRFLAVSDAYLRAINAERKSIVGRPVFVVFPDHPDDPTTASHQSLREAFYRILETGRGESLPVYQYNLPLSEAGGGVSEERHWSTRVSPVFASGNGGQPGEKPRFLLLRTEDVTQSLRSERNLDDANSRIEATLAAAEIGTWIWDVVPNRVTADDNLARIFDVDSRDAIGGPLEHYTRRIHPDDLARVSAGIEAAANEGRRFDMEYRICRTDGSVRWLAARGWAERDASGRPTRFPGVVIDITDRKAAESALRDSDERLRMAIDQTGLGTFDYDPDADVLQWSEGCRRIFGVGLTEPISYQGTFLPALHPDDRAPTMAAVQEAVRPGGSGQYEVEYRVLGREDGAERWVAARGRTIFGTAGQPTRFIGTVLDITARKRSEEAALHRSEQLQKLTAISTRLNAAHDLRSVLGIVTEEARLLIGAQQAVASVVAGPDDAESVTVASHADKDHPGQATAANTSFAVAVEMAGEIPGTVRVSRAESLNHPTLRAGGHTGAPGGWLAAPLVGRSTRRLGVIQLLDKMADDFSADDEALLAQLAQIATVAIENARLYEELRNKDRRKDEFLAMLAHELRNPLAAIRNAVALGSEPSDSAEIEWAMEVINRQLRQLSRLIDDLLDVSRITQGKVQLRKEPLDAATILHAAVETVRPLMEERQHELTVALRPGTLHVEADPTRLEQIVVNLLANAAKYTEKGGEISLRARNENNQVVVRVRDNGVGIPREKLPQMFELFAQGDRTLARSEGGLGIGLTLVRSLAEMHGGSVEALSDGPGTGSEFIVRLPAVAAPPSPPGTSPASREKRIGPERLARDVSLLNFSSRDDVPVPPVVTTPRTQRILVVDDNADSAHGTAMILRRHGHDVRLAYDGPSALVTAREYRPDTILLDIGLPGMDGYEVARQLRADPDLGVARLIAVSGYGQENDRRRSQEAGFDQHLVKPVDPGMLLALLR